MSKTSLDSQSLYRFRKILLDRHSVIDLRKLLFGPKCCKYVGSYSQKIALYKFRYIFMLSHCLSKDLRPASKESKG